MNRTEGLRQLLLSAQAKSPEEQGYIEEMIKLCSTQRPFARTQFEPGHFTASAFVLSADQSALLLILHSKLHRWLQPGGHVEPDDADMRAAVLREVEEETGLGPDDLEFVQDSPLDWDIHPIPGRAHEPAHAHFDVRFLLRAKHDNAQAGSDAQALRYVPFNEVPSIESDASVMRAVQRITELLGIH